MKWEYCLQTICKWSNKDLVLLLNILFLFFFFLSSSLLCLRIQLSMIIIFVKVFTSLKDLSISFLWRTEWLYVFTCTSHLGNILALAWLYNSPHKILLIHFQDNCDSKRFFQSSKFLNNVLMWLLSLCY